MEDGTSWEFIATELDESGIARVVRAPRNRDARGVPGTRSRARCEGRRLRRSRQGGIEYEVVVVPTGDVPDGVRWNMTATIAIQVGE